MRSRVVRNFGFLVVLLGAGFLLGWSVQAPTPVHPGSVQEDNAQAVHLIIDNDTGQLRTFSQEKFFAGATVFDILKTVTTRETLPFVYDPPGQYGVFIRQIGAKKNGEEKKYWQYWVNGQFAMIAADRFILHPNDTILWKFASEQNQ